MGGRFADVGSVSVAVSCDNNSFHKILDAYWTESVQKAQLTKKTGRPVIACSTTCDVFGASDSAQNIGLVVNNNKSVNVTLHYYYYYLLIYSGNVV